MDLNPIRAGIADTPEASDFTSVQQRIEEWKSRQQRSDDRTESRKTADLGKTIVKLLGFSDDDGSEQNAIPSSTDDYLALFDWSGRAIVEGKKGAIPDHQPPILQRLNMRPEQYLAYIRKPKYGFANALGALDRLKEYAEHFGKSFTKGQTAAAALFSPS